MNCVTLCVTSTFDKSKNLHDNYDGYNDTFFR